MAGSAGNGARAPGGNVDVNIVVPPLLTMPPELYLTSNGSRPRVGESSPRALARALAYCNKYALKHARPAVNLPARLPSIEPLSGCADPGDLHAAPGAPASAATMPEAQSSVQCIEFQKTGLRHMHRVDRCAGFVFAVLVIGALLGLATGMVNAYAHCGGARA